jgi:hypothetical protein
MARPLAPRVRVFPPRSPLQWLDEIAAAYADAHEAIPVGPAVGVDIAEGDLFHLAPSVCLKFRGIPAAKATLKRATTAALTSYVAMEEREPEVFSKPHLAFAFCYLAAHFGLDLVTEPVVARTMDFIVEHEAELAQMIGRCAARERVRTLPPRR